jgi:hypothetical protein
MLKPWEVTLFRIMYICLAAGFVLGVVMALIK